MDGPIERAELPRLRSLYRERGSGKALALAGNYHVGKVVESQSFIGRRGSRIF